MSPELTWDSLGLKAEHPESEAAIRCFLGDGQAVLELLRRRGRKARVDDHGVIMWPREGDLPAGGIDPGADPITCLVQVLFALYGPAWMTSDWVKGPWQETLRLWQQVVKAARAMRGQ